MLEVHDLHKSYGEVRALNGVTMGVEPGQIVGLLGPNGAGKTTLVSIIAALRRPDSGYVTVDGLDVSKDSQRTSELIGLAPQDTGVYPVLPVKRNLELFGKIAGLRGSTLASRIEDTVESVGLADLIDRKVGTLSGGEKRRLHTAIALLHQPPLLLLDEATTGTDVETRKHLIDFIKDIALKGTAILYSTHYLGEVEDLGASAAIIEDGQLIANGEVSDLIAGHGRSFVELTFEGPPPAIDGEFEAEIDGSVLRVFAERPGEASARVIGSLGESSRRLMEVEIIRPSLETVYLTLTGRRFDAGEMEPEHVPAS